MNVQKKCPTCGAEISATADGLCLKCLGRMAFFADPPGAGGRLRLGDYELLEEIARGGMGVVYRARQLSLNRIVALKVVLHGPFSSADFVRRFHNEAQVVAKLNHPNIVAIHEIGEHDGNHFIALEFIEGRNFSEFARERPLPAHRTATYLKGIAEAVEHAHQRGVLHRDLKPSNVLLDPFDQPRVTDFGLAKLIHGDVELTTTGQVLGSPNYMPPEQAAGKFADSSAQSDVYSLGAILYELLTGRPPFQGETLSSILAQVQDVEPVPPRRLNPNTPPDLQTICLKCLQKEPVRRYLSAQALADDLGRFLAGEPILARPVSSFERIWLWCRRRPLLAAMSIGLMLAVVFGVAGILWEWRAADFYAQGEWRQRLIAEKDAAETRLNLYAADVAFASEVIQDDNYGLARRTLDRLRPQRGEPDLRGFEWRYLWNLCQGEELATLTGHKGTVTCAAFSPDGKFIATGGQDGTVRIWNAARQECFKTLSPTGNVYSLAFSPDGKNLLTGSDRSVALWDTDSWQVEKTFPGTLAAFSKTGTLLATAAASPFFWEPAGAVRLYDWRTGKLLHQFDANGRAVALSGDGQLLAVAGAANGIALWDTASGKLLKKWPTKNVVWAMNFSPDARKLLTTDWSSNVSLWSTDSESTPQVFPGGQLHVWSAVFSADGATIATTSSDQSVRLWDATTLRLKSTLHGHSGEVWCAAFSPNGRMLVTGGKDQKVLLWPTTAAPSQKNIPHDGDFRPLFSPNGKWLVTVNPDTDYSVLWDANSRALLQTNPVDGGQVIGFSRDGNALAVFDADGAQLVFRSPDGNIPLKSVALENYPVKVNLFTFNGLSSDQEFFFAIDATGMIYVWNAETGKLRCTIQGPLPPIRNAVLSPHGKQIAVSVEPDNVARLYNCATGAERDLVGHTDFVSGLDFSPDGTTLATGSIDGTIRLWNTANGVTVASLPGHMQETTDVAFSPDGRTLASLGRNESVKLWHLPTLREVVSESEPQAGYWIKFSPDGRRLAVGIGGNQLRLLEAPTE